MRTTPRLAGAALALFAMPFSVAAQDASDQQAAEIAAGTQAFFDELIASAAPNGEAVINWSGDIVVEPQGEFFAMTIPAMTIGPRDMSDGLRIDPIEVDIRPRDDGLYEAEWRIPEAIEAVMGGQRMALVTIADQRGNGVWSSEFETFLSLDLRLAGIEATSDTEPGRFAIEEIIALIDTEETSGGLYDSISEFSMSSLSFDPGAPDAPEALGIDLIAASGTITGADMAAIYEFVDAVEVLIEEGGPDAPGGPSPTFANDVAELIERTPKLIRSFDISYRLEGLDFADEETQVDAQGGQFSLYADGLDGEQATIGMNLEIGDIEIEPPPPMAQFIPSDTPGNIALVGVPAGQVVDIMIGFLRGIDAMGPDGSGMMAVLQLQQALMGGGTVLQVSNVNVITDIADWAFDGEVVPNQAAAFGVTADAEMRIGNMPALIQELQTLPEAGDAVSGLTLLQTMGREETDGQGGPVRVYDFELTADGQFLLNGADMSPLLQQFSR